MKKKTNNYVDNEKPHACLSAMTKTPCGTTGMSIETFVSLMSRRF